MIHVSSCHRGRGLEAANSPPCHRHSLALARGRNSKTKIWMMNISRRQRNCSSTCDWKMKHAIISCEATGSFPPRLHFLVRISCVPRRTPQPLSQASQPLCFSIIPSEYVASWILFITLVPATNPHRQSKWDLIFQCFIRLSFWFPQGIYNEMTPCSAYTDCWITEDLTLLCQFDISSLVPKAQRDKKNL